MARVRGCGGDVLFDGTRATGIREWNLDYTVDVLDGRGFDDACQPNPIMGMRTWGGNFRGPKDGGPLELFTENALQLHESTNATQRWTGQALITEIHPTVSVEGLVEYSYTFMGVGTLTVPTA